MKTKEETELYKIWKEDYTFTMWEDFRDNYFECSECGIYDNQQCICYTR